MNRIQYQIYLTLKVATCTKKFSKAVNSNNLALFVEFCDEKFFTNAKKCSIINIDFNQMHESALI